MHLGQIAAEQPDKAAVIMAGSGQTITFAELDAAANRLAHVLFESGLRPGGHVAFMLENRWEFLAVAWAAQRSGLYYTPVSSRLQADECAYIVDDCGAEVFIASTAVADVAMKVSAATPQVRLRLMMDSAAAGFVSYEEITAAASAAPLPRELEGRDMLYSSGTTGRPKGVKPELPLDPMGTSNSLYQLLSVLFPPDGDSVYLSPAPLYHAAPLRYCIAMHRFGVPVVVLDKFDPEQALAAIETYREPVVHEYYAATEGSFFTYASPADWLAHKGTVGRPLTGQPHVCDADGSELPVGEVGILYFSGGPEFEYHGDPAKTAASRDPKGRGWMTVGDVGYLDEGGFIYLTDRVSHMIISGGVNIYPQEAENLLAVHPKVADVAVIGVPDPEMGEQVKAVVQPASMDDAGPELAAELIAYCRDHLAHYKCPRSVDFRADLPRHPTGKLLKRVLRDQYAQARAVQEAPR